MDLWIDNCIARVSTTITAPTAAQISGQLIQFIIVGRFVGSEWEGRLAATVLWRALILFTSFKEGRYS